MSITGKDDPVEVIIDLIDNSTDSDWARTSVPSVERQEASTQKTKGNRSGDYAYVYSVGEGNLEVLGVDADASDGFTDYIENKVVRVDFWVMDNASQSDAAGQAYDLALDFREVIQSQWLDNRQDTDWDKVRPVREIDLRKEANPRSADHKRMVVEVECERDVDVSESDL